jgi:hypothetical protein
MLLNLQVAKLATFMTTMTRTGALVVTDPFNSIISNQQADKQFLPGTGTVASLKSVLEIIRALTQIGLSVRIVGHVRIGQTLV